MTGTASVGDTLRGARSALQASASGALDAELLLADVLNCTRSALYREPARELGPEQREAFGAKLRARAHGCPLAYLTGRAEFWSLTFTVNEAVLVPRPETELVVETALEYARGRRALRILDLGTGSGAIAAAVARECPEASVIASDRSGAALNVAQENFRRLKCVNVTPVTGSWLDPFAASSIDLILANPPYIAEGERGTLAPELAFEPGAALFSGAHGLDDLEQIILGARQVLRSGGLLVVEHGAAQGAAVRRAFRARGYRDILTLRDLAGHERVTRASSH